MIWPPDTLQGLLGGALQVEGATTQYCSGKRLKSGGISVLETRPPPDKRGSEATPNQSSKVLTRVRICVGTGAKTIAQQGGQSPSTQLIWFDQHPIGSLSTARSESKAQSQESP